MGARTVRRPAEERALRRLLYTFPVSTRRVRAGWVRVLVGVVVGVWAAGAGAQTAPTADAGAAHEGGGRVVLVLPFENRSGQPGLDWVSESFPDTLDQRFASAGFLTISRDDRLYALDHLGLPADFRPSRATTIRMAQTLDANFVVVGNFTVQGGRMEVQAQVLDTDRLRMSAPLADSAELGRLLDVENAEAWKLAREMDPGFRVSQQTFLAASAGVKLSAFENYIRGTTAVQPPERVKRLQAAVADAPNYPAALLALGKAQYGQRQYEEAATTLAKVPASDRRALEAGFYRGLARFNQNKYAEAEAAFGFVASQLPLPEVVNNQGVAASRQGKDAAPLFQRASGADPNDPDYHYNLAVALLRRGDTAGATKELTETLRLRPQDAEAKQLQSRVGMGKAAVGSEDSGFQAVERIRRTFSETSFRQAAFQMDQMRMMRIAALPAPERATQLTDAGREYLQQGLLPEAEQEFQSAIAADPANAGARASLAQVREQSGDTEAAKAEAQASLRLKPNVAAYLVLSRLELRDGQLGAAASDVGNALKLEPSNTAAQGMRQALAARGQPIP